MIDASGNILGTFGHGVAMDSLRAPDRFRNVLFEGGHDYEYGVIRIQSLRRMMGLGSYHHADRMFNTELALYGRFRQVSGWLYFRREHAGRPPQTVRDRCVTFDPRRADRLRHPAVRLYGEYLWAYVRAIRKAPASASDQRECYATSRIGWPPERCLWPPGFFGASRCMKIHSRQRRSSRSTPSYRDGTGQGSCVIPLTCSR